MSFKETEVGYIPKEWRISQLIEEVIITMGQSPKSEFYNNIGDGVPFMQGRTTFGDKYHWIDTWCTEPKRFAKKNDVLMSVRAPVGDVNIAKMNLCIGRGLCSFRMKNGNNEYLYYLLKNYVSKIISRETGTVFGSINKVSIESLKLPFPSNEEQKSIAHILSTLDEKIEVNNQINKTLENMAQAIFKHWFVDFEFPCLPENYKFSRAGKPDDFEKVCTYKRVGGLPIPDGESWFVYVLLCEDGSFYKGMTNDLYRRFYEHYTGNGAKWTKTHKPLKVIHYEKFNTQEDARKREEELKTGIGREWIKREYKKHKTGSSAHQTCLMMAGEMVESELGMIPKGWEVGKLSRLIDNIKENAKQGEHLKCRKYIPIDTMSIRSVTIKEFKSYEEAKSSLILFEEFDILIGAMRVYFHRVNLAPFKGVTRTTTFVLRSKSKEDISYNLFLLNLDETINYADKTSKGTTMPYAIWENGLAEMMIIQPPQILRTKFNNIIFPMLEKMINNDKCNIYLKELRDTLLPKLMSGEIRVPCLPEGTGKPYDEGRFTCP